MIRSYGNLPSLPDAGLLLRYLDTFGVVVPIARTNEITNPSAETNTTSYTAGSGTLTRSTDQQYHGAYSLKYVPAAGVNDGFYYGTISMTAGQLRAISCKWYGAAGIPYKFSVATTAGVDLTTYRFTGTGRWQWIWLYWIETSTTTRRIYFTKDNSASVAAYYVDGVQSEVISTGESVSTYIDGDQQGLVPNQYPPAYGWTGTPHASTSYRIGQTRAGGYVVKFRDLGFLLTTIIGLGMAPPDHQALTFAQLDGGQYENTIKPPRQFSLAGRWGGYTPTELDAGQAKLGALLDRDLVGQRQPLVLTTQAMDCGAPIGEMVQMQALYSGGLEGNIQELPSAAGSITFTQYLPMVLGHDQGVSLDVQDAIASPGGILARAPNGTWAKLGAGVSGGDVRAIVVAPSGLVYVGGSFTAAGATSADYIASYDPATGTWAVLASATALNAAVEALAIGPDGRLYVGGSFTNASGIAAADFIAVWNPVTLAWAALSTGMNAVVDALAIAPGGVLYAGGNFTTAGGGAAARVAAWDGSAWSALGTGANAEVFALAIAPNGLLYIGGGFTNGGGTATADYIASYDPSTGVWAGLSTGMDFQVNALTVGKDGTLYAGGLFMTAGGVVAGGVAAWNGIGWRQLGSGFSSPGTDTPNSFAVQANGVLLIASTGAVIDPGAPNAIFAWNGSAYVDLGIRVSTPGDEGTAIALAPDGTIYAGMAGTITAGGLTTAPNGGTAYAYPRLTITGPTTGTSRIFSLMHRSTGAEIHFNYTINAGETAVLTLNPTNITFVSTFQGNVLNTILPGSDTTAFLLQPGDNVILFLAASSTVTAVLQWPIGYTNLSNAIRRTVP